MLESCRATAGQVHGWWHHVTAFWSDLVRAWSVDMPEEVDDDVMLAVAIP